MNVRPFADDDLAAVYAIQLKCPQAAQWHAEDYTQLASDPLGTVLIGEVESENPGGVAGFAAFHRVMDEAELRNMAVHPEHRHKGLARALLAAAILDLQRNGVSRIFLEVRASNQAAIAFYASAGFNPLHTRRDYYRDPAEDAVVMVYDIGPRPANSAIQK